MSKRYKRLLSVIISIVLLAGIATAVGAVDIFSLKNSEQAAMASDSDTIILRVCNWEEYIDTGDWDEAIELDSGEIKGENSIVKDFEDWYYQIYGKKVVVEYSTVGTNEELYNMLTLGDEYDLICPSEYMIMKLMAEGWLEPFSEQFFDKNVTENFQKSHRKLEPDAASDSPDRYGKEFKDTVSECQQYFCPYPSA